MVSFFFGYLYLCRALNEPSTWCWRRGLREQVTCRIALIFPECKKCSAKHKPIHSYMPHEQCRRGKLCLVLDLDHTLVNSAKFSEVTEPQLAETLQRRTEEEAASLAAEQRLLFALPQIGMWTKLRPGVREFLSSADEFFELWIHTNGNRCGQRPVRPRVYGF